MATAMQRSLSHSTKKVVDVLIVKDNGIEKEDLLDKQGVPADQLKFVMNLGELVAQLNEGDELGIFFRLSEVEAK
jgi:hypothetical protein